MVDDDDLDVPQFSDETRARLRAASAALVAAIEAHTETFLSLGGGTKDLTRIFTENDEVRRAAVRWDDAVFAHTGTSPLPIDMIDDDEEDDGDEEDDATTDGPSTFVSVVARWDLEIVDPAALVE